MIIDASVAFKWLAKEPGSEQALDVIGTGTLIAPVLLLSEVANGLRKQAKREQITIDEALAANVRNLGRLIELRDETEDVAAALLLAQELDHSVYDCVYLAMAIRLNESLLTADEKFARKLARTRHHGLVQVLQ